MGRVFDALRRQQVATPETSGDPKQSTSSAHRGGRPRSRAGVPSSREIEEQLLTGSSIMSVANATVRSSASTAHTADVPGGSALPGGFASRDAGGTLDAAGSARVGGFISYDISPARVGAHSVAGSEARA